MKQLRSKALTALEKELLLAEKQEIRLEKAALKAKPSAIKCRLVGKIPDKVYSGLESAFCKAFTLVFAQGKNVIERSYKRENIIAEHAIRDYAFELKGSRKELKQLHKKSGKADLLNLTVTSIEGIGLGALGVGMPDIVVFIGMLLKGVYETALNYGFDYSSRREQIIILKMMETSLSFGEDWGEQNKYVDHLFESSDRDFADCEFDLAIRSCASAFAADMLLLKFVQGFPLVGALGGAANPVYYSKVMKYVGLKYKKQYLKRKIKENTP